VIDLLIDTNVLIHLLHPTSNAEAGLSRQLLDWDRAGYIRLLVPAASGSEQGRSIAQLEFELEALGLPQDRIVDVTEHSDNLLNEISLTLGHRKAGDWIDAQVVYTALDHIQRGYDTWLVTGDRNILRHAEELQVLDALPIMSLRAAVNQQKADLPLTKIRLYSGAR
jgi:hypothetical protein